MSIKLNESLRNYPGRSVIGFESAVGMVSVLPAVIQEEKNGRFQLIILRYNCRYEWNRLAKHFPTQCACVGKRYPGNDYLPGALFLFKPDAEPGRRLV
jgi:hypothetical protein